MADVIHSNQPGTEKKGLMLYIVFEGLFIEAVRLVLTVYKTSLTALFSFTCLEKEMAVRGRLRLGWGLISVLL